MMIIKLRELPASLLLIAGLCLTGCGVNIETGPPTADERSRTSEVRGKGVRSDWVNRFELATVSTKGMMFKTFVDSVSSRYIEYGYSVSDQWRQGNEGRGQEVSDTEMREMVARWTETEKPLIESYDDVVEYAIVRAEIPEIIYRVMGENWGLRAEVKRLQEKVGILSFLSR